jgi:TolB protein
MRESESFDAFYARTVADVTSRMHALADGDPQADHAIREAYARAYQQWFEVSGFRDAEGWVLDAAKDAFERRRAQAGLAPAPAAAVDSGTWPNMYREPHVPRQAPPAEDSLADPDATMAPPVGAQPGTARPGTVHPGTGHPGTGHPGSAEPGEARPGLTVGGAIGQARPEPYSSDLFPETAPGEAGAGRLPGSRRALGGGPGARGDRKALIAGAVAIALVVISAAAYLAFGRGHSTPPATGSAGSHAKAGPPVTMLKAGQVGQRSAVPWSLLGAGWTLAEFSGEGSSVTTYMIDPEGGRYDIAAWPGAGSTTLVAWSGNGDTALYETSSGSGASYTLLSVQTGAITHLSLPAGVALAGFTRPDGLNLVAVQQGPARYKLERYNLQGALQATLSAVERRPAQPAWTDVCDSGCGAISSPDGDTAVWGVAGDEMQLVDNAGGLIRRLHVPQSGTPPSCTPISWWSSQSVLASCTDAAQPGTTRLWLVPVSGSAPTPLTLASGSGSGAGFYTGAWRAGGSTYVTATSSAQCPSAASGPGGLGILRLAAGGAATAVNVPGSTGNHNDVLGSSGGRLLVLSQTGCPGSSSLMWLNPSSGATQPLLSAPSGGAGVVAAVAYVPH